MEIRKLCQEDMQRAMELKVLCWTEELAGKAENTKNVAKETTFWTNWMNAPDEHNDIRLLLGAFENSNLLGVAFASFVEDKDAPEGGIELNGLWVFPEHRGKGISIKLILETINFFIPLGVSKLIVYNHHYAPSNAFYKKFGGKVVDAEYQMDGKLLVDIFEFDILNLKNELEKTLKRHINPVRQKMNIRLVEVNKDNWNECIELSVSDEQAAFVAPNYESILLAKFEENCYPMCIYDDKEMIGFLMYDIDPETKRWELSRFMVDKKHQGKGFGKQALLLLLEKLKETLGSVKFYTSVVPENTTMKRLIESAGFSKTGEIMWDEEVFFKTL